MNHMPTFMIVFLCVVAYLLLAIPALAISDARNIERGIALTSKDRQDARDFVVASLWGVWFARWLIRGTIRISINFFTKLIQFSKDCWVEFKEIWRS
jgi:hypothetical protein